MEKIRSTLTDWLALPVTMVPLDGIETDEALQPRALGAVVARDRYRLMEASELHITRLRADLAAFPGKETEPLLVAEVDGRRLLVDGHHRKEAYRLARRSVAPVRLLRLSMGEAVMVSRRFGERFCAMVAKAPHPRVPHMAAQHLRAEGKDEAADLLEQLLDAERVDDPHSDY